MTVRGLPVALAMVVVLLSAGCSNSASPPPNSSPSTGSAISSHADASQSPDPAVLRAAAGKAYLAAAHKYDAAIKAINKKYPSLKTLKAFHSYSKAGAAAEGAFIADLKKITPPADTAGDLKALIAKEAAVQASEIELSTVNAADYESALRPAEALVRQATAAANLIRIDLRLPPV